MLSIASTEFTLFRIRSSCLNNGLWTILSLEFINTFIIQTLYAGVNVIDWSAMKIWFFKPKFEFLEIFRHRKKFYQFKIGNNFWYMSAQEHFRFRFDDAAKIFFLISESVFLIWVYIAHVNYPQKIFLLQKWESWISNQYQWLVVRLSIIKRAYILIYTYNFVIQSYCYVSGTLFRFNNSFSTYAFNEELILNFVQNIIGMGYPIYAKTSIFLLYAIKLEHLFSYILSSTNVEMMFSSCRFSYDNNFNLRPCVSVFNVRLLQLQLPKNEK